MMLGCAGGSLVRCIVVLVAQLVSKLLAADLVHMSLVMPVILIAMAMQR